MAQTKYLWLLLILGAFYWAVHSDVTSPPEAPTPLLTIPGTATRFPVLTVWATGGPVLLFVLLVILGALRAYTRAYHQLAPASDDETVDDHPNAIDWAADSTAATPKALAWLLGFSYPLYMTVFAVEATILLLTVARWPVAVPGRELFTILGIIEAVPVYLLLLPFWYERVVRGFPWKSAT